MNLLAVIIALASFVLGNPNIPQDVKDNFLRVISQNVDTTQPTCSAPVASVTPAYTPSVSHTTNTTQIIPVEPTASSYTIGEQKCIVNRRLYGTTTPQAIYEIEPSTGFNRSVIKGTVVSENNTTSDFGVGWTPYNVPYTSTWYDPDLARAKSGIDTLNNNDVINYTVYLYQNGEGVNQFTGRLQYHNCQ